jgi:hypothetical protein
MNQIDDLLALSYCKTLEELAQRLVNNSLPMKEDHGWILIYLRLNYTAADLTALAEHLSYALTPRAIDLYGPSTIDLILELEPSRRTISHVLWKVLFSVLKGFLNASSYLKVEILARRVVALLGMLPPGPLAKWSRPEKIPGYLNKMDEAVRRLHPGGAYTSELLTILRGGRNPTI